MARAASTYQVAEDQVGFDLDDPTDEYARMGDPSFYEPGKMPYRPMRATGSGVISSWPINSVAMRREIDARVEMLMIEDDPEKKLELAGEARGIAIGLAMLHGCSIEQVSMESLQRHQKRHSG